MVPLAFTALSAQSTQAAATVSASLPPSVTSLKSLSPRLRSAAVGGDDEASLLRLRAVALPLVAVTLLGRRRLRGRRIYTSGRHFHTHVWCKAGATSAEVALGPWAPGARRPGLGPSALVTRTRPRDVLQGFVQALKLAAAGILIGICTIIVGLVSAVTGVRSRGLLFFVKALVVAVVGGACATGGGVIVALVQLLRGVANTPESLRARWEHKLWDVDNGRWIDANLTALRVEIDARTLENDAVNEASVIDTEFYDLLKVAPGAHARDIKKAYYREARECHPDINPGDDAKAQFQRLAEAYHILSDPDTRKQYDSEGKNVVMGDGMFGKMDPAVFFSVLFGSEPFEPWIGELQLSTQAKQFAKAGNRPKPTPGSRPEPTPGSSPKPTPGEAMQTLQETLQERMVGASNGWGNQVRREVLCACNLREKLDIWANADDAELRRETASLAAAPGRGPELLAALGDAYSLAAMPGLAEGAPVSALLAVVLRGALNVRQRFMAARKLVSGVLGLARQMKRSQKQKQKKGPQAAPNLDEALPLFLQAAWSTVVLDVDRTASRAAELALQDRSASREVRLQRSQTLKRLGAIFQEEGLRVKNGVAEESAASARANVERALAGSLRGKQQARRAD